MDGLLEQRFGIVLNCPSARLCAIPLGNPCNRCTTEGVISKSVKSVKSQKNIYEISEKIYEFLNL